MKLKLIVACLLFSITAYAKNDVKLEKVSVYKHYDGRGYTTASAWGNITDLINEATPVLDVDSANLKQLEAIMNRAKRRRHFQTKLGQRILFMQMNIDNSTNSGLITGRCIVDLSKKVNYIIEEETDKQWLEQFRNRMVKVIES